MKEIKTYTAMNEQIADILKFGDEPEQYAAQYIKELQAENAALRERLEKSVELPRIIHPNKNEWFIQYQLKSGIIDYSIRYSKEAAEARLAELKGESNETTN